MRFPINTKITSVNIAVIIATAAAHSAINSVKKANNAINIAYKNYKIKIITKIIKKRKVKEVFNKFKENNIAAAHEAICSMEKANNAINIAGKNYKIKIKIELKQFVLKKIITKIIKKRKMKEVFNKFKENDEIHEWILIN